MRRGCSETSCTSAKKIMKKGQRTNCEENIIVFCLIFILIERYLLLVVQLADEHVQQVEVATLEEQVDEAKQVVGALHLLPRVGQP